MTTPTSKACDPANCTAWSAAHFSNEIDAIETRCHPLLGWSRLDAGGGYVHVTRDAFIDLRADREPVIDEPSVVFAGSTPWDRSPGNATEFASALLVAAALAEAVQ